MTTTEYFREWRRKNPERVRAALARYRKKHKAKIAARRHRRYEAHRAEEIRKARAYRAANIERYRAYDVKRGLDRYKKVKLSPDQYKQWLMRGMESKRRARAELTDWYVRDRISRGRAMADLSSLVDVKRLHILVGRAVKNPVAIKDVEVGYLIGQLKREARENSQW